MDCTIKEQLFIPVILCLKVLFISFVVLCLSGFDVSLIILVCRVCIYSLKNSKLSKFNNYNMTHCNIFHLVFVSVDVIKLFTQHDTAAC